MPNGLAQFVERGRIALQHSGTAHRAVYVSEIKSSANGQMVAAYISDRAPLFYRKLQNLMERFAEGFFLTAIRETLAKLPTSESFRESHFGEISAGIFAEDVMGLKIIYSKLALLTAENSNAYKIDLVLCDPFPDPIELVFGQVKSSPKTASTCFPAGHDTSCYSDVFRSMNDYLDKDLSFDLTAANDNLSGLQEPLRSKVKDALKPYSNTKVRYAAFAVIDRSTKHEPEMSILLTRKNAKVFDVDVICFEDFPAIAQNVFNTLERLK